ncbi:XVIPCD domain-containing protein [Lysobacter sp. M2-1]|uniref:XVIPCD domain-containing protein n=1 Tax=Lysobacter sp. M2-1 TaxID=2916839 RepID=UPI001F587614|nr:XVIPCD domain-containing protein [Lysobacter sp. M2-1]
MDAVVDRAGIAGDPSSSDSQILRRYAGQDAPVAVPSDYTVLLPSDEAWPRRTVLRAVVADALQRNGKVVDEDTLDATVASVAADTGPLGNDALVWKLQQGESRDDGRVAPPFHGYAAAMPAQLQRSLLAYAGDWSSRRDAPPPPLDASIAQLRSLATTQGQSDVARTLEAIDAAIRAGQAASAAGQPVDAVALRTVLEFATRMGKEREAAKILERYTAIKGVASDAKTIGREAERVFNGRDPLTGKPLNTDQRVDAAFNLLSAGFQVAGEIGNLALMFGARNSGLVAGLIGVAPAGMAIVAFAAGAYELIKKAREALLQPQWDEFRARFPGAEGIEPKQFVSATMRQIAGMPTDPGNAASTSSRVLELLGGSPETRQRFLAFLKGKVEPDSMVDALATGRLDGLGKEHAAELARAAKGSARDFLQHEIDDTKRYVRDRDGDRTRGSYLLEGAARAGAERNTNQLGGTVDEVLRVGGILTSTGNQLHARFNDMLGKVKGVGGLQVDGRALDEEQHKRVAAAVVAATGQLPVDALVMNKAGTHLLAVSNPQSESRQIVSIELDAALKQSIEASSRMAAANPVVVLTQADAAQARHDAIQRGM